MERPAWFKEPVINSKNCVNRIERSSASQDNDCLGKEVSLLLC